MKFADTLRGFWRRWYIVIPGLLISVLLVNGAWYLAPAGYERSATQLLVPGSASIPEDANPYLFLGGLSPAADVLVRAAGSENVLKAVVREYPGVQIEISRDTTTAGPVILIVVTADSDAAAEEVLALLLAQTASVLDDIQDAENVAAENRVTVMPITVDNQSILNLRTRLITMGAAGLGGIALTLFLASLVDGLSRKRRDGPSDTGDSRPESTAPDRHDFEPDDPRPIGDRAAENGPPARAAVEPDSDAEPDAEAALLPHAR